MLVFTPAKINLGLNVIEKRTDGFHNLETVFYPIDWKDVLEVVPAEHGEIRLHEYGIKVDVEFEKHLCVKAYRLLAKDFDLPGVEVYLHKNLPMGAGLGGGSSNAAGMLKALNELAGLGLNQEQLITYASRIGSDCALFMHDGPTRGEGRGEVLTPYFSAELERLHREGYRLLLIKPPFGVSTAEAYAGIHPHPSEMSPWEVLQLPIKEWKGKLINDFEPSVFKKCPKIKDLKEDMYNFGAEFASMSGSGSSVFGFFPPDWKLPDNLNYPEDYVIKIL